jgi:hypothetical protein
MAIGNAVQRGSTVTIYDERGRITGTIVASGGPKDGLKSFMASVVTMRRGNWLYLHDERGRQVGSMPAWGASRKRPPSSSLPARLILPNLRPHVLTGRAGACSNGPMDRAPGLAPVKGRAAWPGARRPTVPAAGRRRRAAARAAEAAALVEDDV